MFSKSRRNRAVFVAAAAAAAADTADIRNSAVVMDVVVVVVGHGDRLGAVESVCVCVCYSLVCVVWPAGGWPYTLFVPSRNSLHRKKITRKIGLRFFAATDRRRSYQQISYQKESMRGFCIIYACIFAWCSRLFRRLTITRQKFPATEYRFRFRSVGYRLIALPHITLKLNAFPWKWALAKAR